MGNNNISVGEDFKLSNSEDNDSGMLNFENVLNHVSKQTDTEKRIITIGDLMKKIRSDKNISAEEQRKGLKDFKKELEKIKEGVKKGSLIYFLTVYNLGNANSYLMEHEKCIENFSECLKFFEDGKKDTESSPIYDLKTMLFNAHLNRGVSFVVLEKLDKALNDFEICLKYDEKSISLRHKLGLVLIKMKKFDSAIKEFDFILNKNKNDDIALNNRGKCLLEQKKYSEALKDFKKALDNKDDVRTLINICFCFVKMKNKKDGLIFIERAKTKDVEIKTKKIIEELEKEINDLSTSPSDNENNNENNKKVKNDSNILNDNQFNEDISCKICLERKISIIFNCGHSVCAECSETLGDLCPFCKQQIKTKIKWFNV